MERALQFLAETDEKAASLKADVARTEYVAKLRESSAYLTASGETVKERESIAKTAPDVQEGWDLHFKAIAEFEKVRARRERAVLVCDLFRTLAANRRAGQV
jgi:hypothetical protein